MLYPLFFNVSGALEGLNLQHNSIRELPSDYRSCRTLQRLYLGHNLLTQLPHFDGLSESLMTMYMQNNKISKFDYGALTILKRVRLVDLKANQIKTVDMEKLLTKWPSIFLIYLAGNRLTSIQNLNCVNFPSTHTKGN